MKLFRIRFTTEYELTPFGDVEDIIDTSMVLGMDLKFHSGGWNKGEPTTCYHEWKTDADPEIVKNYLETRYGKSLLDIYIQEMNLTSGSAHIPWDPSKDRI
jgi:hypothetical protein